LTLPRYNLTTSLWNTPHVKIWFFYSKMQNWQFFEFLQKLYNLQKVFRSNRPWNEPAFGASFVAANLNASHLQEDNASASAQYNSWHRLCGKAQQILTFWHPNFTFKF
jgi:hypothetical protein